MFVTPLNVVVMAIPIEFYRKIPRVDFDKAADLKKTDVVYKLYTHRSVATYKELTEDNVKQENLNKTIPTVLLLHGWNSSYSTPWYPLIKDELFRIGPHNVIYLDWSLIAKKTYSVSCASVKPLGKVVAEFFIASDVPLEKIHLIGK